MNLQLIEIYVPEEEFPLLDSSLEKFEFITRWVSQESTGYKLVRVLVSKENSEDILNYLEKTSQQYDEWKALLFSLQTSIPNIKEDESQKNSEKEKDERELIRASRHELYSVVHSSSETSKSFSWFLVFSALVAAAGIFKNSPAIVIGAMMIAPLIGPFTALAFASVLGDYKLLRKSITSSFYGLILPISIAVFLGIIFELPLESQEYSSRMNIEFIDIIAALASGAAGAISFLKRVSEAFVGVMVSVALLPPAVVFGMTVGAAQWEEAVTPILLLLVNISSIVLSAIIVFWLSGIQPVKWGEIQEAYTSRKYALLFVSIIILVLCIAIYFINF
ncbi:TIGR00341 family protein [Alteribacillus iranensis]|uniref:TIGR00341 family protein n=1 Tax=Alteribacillus iranensis TaxID=930128 RepID=A0A1I2E2T7_9BACI|nr:TIGR00341 family protein [Alteribacillus iranensis]SFE86976.1 TIGR00341 family protein [Alteribacillus iranensis]